MFLCIQYPAVYCEGWKCKMTAYTFYINSMVLGYHDHQSIWDNPLADGDLDGDLLCEWETGHSHDLPAMDIKKTVDGTMQVVGHVPRKISLIC